MSHSVELFKYILAYSSRFLGLIDSKMFSISLKKSLLFHPLLAELYISVCFAIRNNKMSRRQRKRKISEKKEKLILFEGFLGNCGRLKVFFSQ